MAEEIFPPLCEMEFIARETGKRVTVRLTIPILDKDNGDWFCLSEILGSEEDERKRIYGCCPFQAIELSMTWFRLFFEKQAEEFRSADEYLASPYTIFPKHIPWCYGLDVYQRLVGMVREETQKIEDKLTLCRETRTRKGEGGD